MKNKENFSSLDENLLSLRIKKVEKATCIITSNNIKSVGFFVSLPINMGDRYLYGLLTSNHILSKEQLKPSSNINLDYFGSNQSLNYIIPDNSFVFTCPFIDISFIEIPLGTFKDVEYLRVWEEPLVNQKVYFIQKSKDIDLSFTEGNITEFFGNDIRYKINDKTKDIPLEGSALISLSKFSLGDVIGINKGYVLDQKDGIYYATHINIIINSIKSLVNNNILKSSVTLSPAKSLSNAELDTLKKIGLKSTDNPYIFISPGEFFITPLWFYRTQYAWFWTPSEPKDFSMERIKKCNWSLIKANRPITAIGGIYNNMAPAQKNIKLITILIISGIQFLVPKQI